MKYVEGRFEDVCHEHVPAHRMSDEAAREALRSIVARFSDWPGQFIVRSLLNRRTGEPSCYPGFRYHTAYPEPGAIRQYIAGTAINAWYDSALSREPFRPKAGSHDA